MAVALWWKERLADRQPIGLEALRVEGYNIKSGEGTWPRAVARQALFEDYKAWFDETFLPPYRATGYYADFPDQLPKPADELSFFTTLAPFLYVVGKKQQVRNYLVNHRVPYEGKWVATKVNRYFVRLVEWEAHVAAFELQTGINVNNQDAAFCALKAQIVNKSVTVAIRRIAANKEAMPLPKGG